MTLDESWLYFATSHEQIWLRPDEEPPERARHTIQHKKLMVTIAWNALGFHVLDALPKGRIFNAEYYLDNILTALVSFLPEAGEEQLVVHADNARPHTARKSRTFCEENRLRLATRPPYSPDLAPSNFFLFRHVKNHLQGMTFSTGEELLTGIHEGLADITAETLQGIFEHWMQRLECVSQNNGDYYP
jgi:histone-lysine N-methyltransferase SETMAR